MRQNYTVFRTEHVLQGGADKILDNSWMLQASSAQDAVAMLVEEIAADDPRLDDLSPGEGRGEYEIEMARALDDVRGLFQAWRGEHTTRPAGVAADYEELGVADSGRDALIRRLIDAGSTTGSATGSTPALPSCLSLGTLLGVEAISSAGYAAASEG